MTIDFPKIYDTNRRTVESFDRLLSEIRRMYLVIVGIIVTVSTAVVSNSSIDYRPQLLFIIALLLVTFSIVFWGMDTHYCNYLRIASETACRMENHLGLGTYRLGVSQELALYQGRGDTIGTKVFLFVYVLFYCGAIYVMALCTGHMAADQNAYALAIFIVLATAILLIIAFYIETFTNANRIHKFLEIDYEEKSIITVASNYIHRRDSLNRDEQEKTIIRYLVQLLPLIIIITFTLNALSSIDFGGVLNSLNLAELASAVTGLVSAIVAGMVLMLLRHMQETRQMEKELECEKRKIVAARREMQREKGNPPV